MKKLCIAVLVLLGISDFARASTVGAIHTDRFGYTGLIVHYATLEDAVAGTNAIASYPITTTDEVNNRDLALRIANGFSNYYPSATDRNIIMGSWWYTTAENTNGYPKDHPDGDRLYTGWGNFRGNAGMGYVQLLDTDSSTHSNRTFAFQNFDGTNWTKFTLSLDGAGAGLAQLARLNIDGNGYPADQGYYHHYSLTLTAGGLEGQVNETNSLLIEAFNHPESVTGSFVGLFENTNADERYQGNVGFYTFDLTINMVNWAYEQGDEELNGNFNASYFGVLISDDAPEFKEFGVAAGELIALPIEDTEAGRTYILESTTDLTADPPVRTEVDSKPGDGLVQFEDDEPEKDVIRFYRIRVTTP